MYSYFNWSVFQPFFVRFSKNCVEFPHWKFIFYNQNSFLRICLLRLHKWTQTLCRTQMVILRSDIPFSHFLLHRLNIIKFIIIPQTVFSTKSSQSYMKWNILFTSLEIQVQFVKNSYSVHIRQNLKSQASFIHILDMIVKKFIYQ